MPETKKFKTEVKKLLELVTHSLYTNKDIFVRELVANAADAIDKARFEALTNPDDARKWEIAIIPDKDRKILQITDNGAGMTKKEVVDNIGTIAQSGTKAFIDALEKKDADDAPDLIGQFGVGFYSAFMAADKVEIETKRSGSDEPAVKWTSDGVSSYTIEESDKKEPGTTVSLHLKPDALAYLEEWKIRDVVKKYSDFIEHPVKLATAAKNDDQSEGKLETINSMKAIWLRSPGEVSDEDHANFFAHLDPFGGEPALKTHYSAEGATEFKSLLYAPSKAPFDLIGHDKGKKGLHLYIRRVFITDGCDALLPDYLRFVKGVVDSSDLPLNVSRETLQDNPVIAKINKNLTRKILAELAKLKKEDREKYSEFHKEFGHVLKEGLHSDFENRERLLDIVLFETMDKKPGEMVSIKEYADAMPASQKAIYYIIGETRGEIEKSPHLELFRKNGVDVLIMTDPIDEWVVQAVREYKDKKLQAIDKDEVEMEGDAAREMAEKAEEATKKHAKLIDSLKKHLEDKTDDVRFSKLLSESPCRLIRDPNELSPRMRSVVKAMGQTPPPESKPKLELNPTHPLVVKTAELAEKNPDAPENAEIAEILFDLALVAEGSPLRDPAKFASQIAELILLKLK